MPKEYLYYTQHETDINENPVTALYVYPKATFAQNADMDAPMDDEDKAVLDRVCNELFMHEQADWEMEGYSTSPPEIIRWMSRAENRKIFSTTDKFAQFCKDGSSWKN